MWATPIRFLRFSLSLVPIFLGVQCGLVLNPQAFFLTLYWQVMNMSALGNGSQEDALTRLYLAGENVVIKNEKMDPVVLVNTGWPEITVHYHCIIFFMKDKGLLH